MTRKNDIVPTRSVIRTANRSSGEKFSITAWLGGAPAAAASTAATWRLR
jgi:hypothetical protein